MWASCYGSARLGTFWFLGCQRITAAQKAGATAERRARCAPLVGGHVAFWLETGDEYSKLTMWPLAVLGGESECAVYTNLPCPAGVDNLKRCSASFATRRTSQPSPRPASETPAPPARKNGFRRMGEAGGDSPVRRCAGCPGTRRGRPIALGFSHAWPAIARAAALKQSELAARAAARLQRDETLAPNRRLSSSEGTKCLPAS